MIDIVNEPKEFKTLETLTEKEFRALENRLSKVKVFYKRGQHKQIGITERELFWIITNEKVSLAFIKNVPFVAQRSFFRFWIGEYPKLIPVVFKSSAYDRLKLWLLRDGICPDLSVYDKFIDSYDIDLVVLCAEHCSDDVLKKLKKHKNKRVRIKAYERLGVSDYIDEMLLDKSADVRCHALDYTPYYYPKLSDMIFDKSLNAFRIIVKKIDESCLPLLFASKHINDPVVQEHLEKRFDGDFVI